ncbi:MAG: DUF1801 domain-containing protein [Rhizobiales bacterium]|nr:hypothetical protein [Hyphomicrobiales bacterium]NRB15278.1 DUF1801 domain-containing protein [Hyphomicrobiales bacterium]
MQYEKDLISPHKDLFLTAQAYLMSFDGMVETKKPRITTYSNANGGICHLRTMPHGIDFGFLKGAKMQDDLGKLTGNGKVMRVLPMIEFDKQMADYYLHQAIELIAK